LPAHKETPGKLRKLARRLGFAVAPCSPSRLYGRGLSLWGLLILLLVLLLLVLLLGLSP